MSLDYYRLTQNKRLRLRSASGIAITNSAATFSQIIFVPEIKGGLEGDGVGEGEGLVGVEVGEGVEDEVGDVLCVAVGVRTG